MEAYLGDAHLPRGYSHYIFNTFHVIQSLSFFIQGFNVILKQNCVVLKVGGEGFHKPLGLQNPRNLTFILDPH